MGPHNDCSVVKFGELYLIYSDGRIWSNTKGSFISTWVGNKGYLMIKAYGRTRTVHRIIAECFIPNEHGLKTVNHKNGNRLDNRVENLEWCSYAENNLHSWNMNRDDRSKKIKDSQTGSKNNQAKLTEEQVREIRRDYIPNTYGLRAQFAEKYEVSIGTIKNVVSGRWWKHV